MLMTAFTPLYKENRLVYGKGNEVAIVSLWPKANKIAEGLDSSKYAVIGNLFSAERGLDILARNLLANPQITSLVITGADLSKSGIVLADFFDKGFYSGETAVGKPCWRVNSEYAGYIGKDIPEHALNALRESINVMRVDDVSQIHDMPAAAAKREKMIFMKPEEKEEKRYCAGDIGFFVQHDKVAGVWLQILDTILKFGKRSGTQYDDEQKEILNLISVITNEEPESLHIPDFMPLDEKAVREYIPTITTDHKPDGTSYTYGSRMRSWFGIDQVKEAIAKLSRQHISRAVVINLWDSAKDLTIGGSPCMNHIWLRIRDNKLYMTATIRSNDMFEGYPQNAYGLRCLQELIRKELAPELKRIDIELSLGSLIINSQSAHIYSDCWETARIIVEKHYDKYVPKPSMRYDSRGNFVINADRKRGEIVVEYTSPDNEHLFTLRGRSVRELRDMIARENIISDPAHGVYVGIELCRAEAALKNKSEYEQDGG